MFFKKTNKGKPSAGDTGRDRAAQGVARFLQLLQNRFSDFMNRRVNRMGRTSKQIWLAVFLLVFGGGSIYVLAGALRTNQETVRSVKPGQLSVPKYFDQPGTIRLIPTLTGRDVQRIMLFKKYMDSLAGPLKGKLPRDSLLKERPGLKDSIRLMEDHDYSK